MPRNKRRDPATVVTRWPGVDQSGRPILATIAEAMPPGSGSGDVVGPASAVNNDVVTFNGVTGKLVKDSGVLVSNLVVTSDARLSDARTPTAHATSHASAGSDPLTLTEAQITNLVTDLAAKASFAQALMIASFRG